MAYAERMRPIDGDWQTISCFLGQKQMLMLNVGSVQPRMKVILEE